jgi:spore germination cell wall hydrolase CwlJ-like protein
MMKNVFNDTEHAPFMELSDSALMGLCIHMEARGELTLGKKAIGQVILNRFNAKPQRYGSTIREIVLRPYAFSWLLPSDPQFMAAKDIALLPFHTWPEAAQACAGNAACLVAGYDTVPEIQDATLYFNPEAVPGGWPHSWAKDRVKKIVVIGKHHFYKEI